MRTCDLENWKEALAMALTYAKADEFTKLCGKLSVFSIARVLKGCSNFTHSERNIG